VSGWYCEGEEHERFVHFIGISIFTHITAQVSGSAVFINGCTALFKGTTSKQH